ncbi:nucleoside phosphorylase [Legionella nagasakiensis]|uniref:nucleoside phosphorylase n=1 Tax=Legionella nagasakiensis TaxID=535290 RepID=UPI001054DD35|nr:nucleoside phosphorylase [Legionella nagasakiensis]
MIKPAELPLNSRGAVYHLDLLPEELADLIITVGDPGRVQQVSRHFDSVELKRIHREFVTHTGYIGQQRISVISTGIGVPNVDIVMNELDALVNIDLATRMPYEKTKQLTIIRLGTTGSLQESSRPGDMVISHFAVGFDTLLDYYQSNFSPELIAMHTALADHLAEACGSFYLVEADNTLRELFKDLGAAAITATCGGFYGPQGRRLRIPLRYPHLLEKLATFNFSNLKILNFEMETAGILGLGQLLGHRCISVSVTIANRITGEFAENIQKQVEHLIIKALQYMGHLSSDSSS